MQINIVKIDIELRKGNVIENLRLYYSLIKTFYRGVKMFIKNSEQYDDKFVKLLGMINYMVKKNQAGGRTLIIPSTLESELESIHNDLNKIRFEKGLLIPTKDEVEHDPSKILEDTGIF